jgi:predicted HNH restriction endonuclease
METCQNCGKPFVQTRSNRIYCRRNCKLNYHVAENRRKNKRRGVELLGGRCQRCGWDEHVAGFHFHHKDPSQKEFRIASGNTIAWDKIKTELEKCVLLCSNCHAVVHATSDPEWVVIPG